MMRKYLPTIIPERPGYPFTAHLLSALYPYEFTYPWIHSNFIQMAYTENHLYPARGHATFPLDMQYTWQDYHLHQYCPFIENVKVHKDMINYKYKSFQEFIEYCISENWFILTSLNNRYIPFSENYQKTDLSHYTFITGIDTELRTARIADFYNFLRYKQYDCPLEELELAYKDSKGYVFDPIEEQITKFIQCYRVTEAVPRYRFDINLIKMKLKDFLSSKDSFGKILECNDFADSDYWVGLSVYDKMIEYAREEGRGHFQSFAYLVEHKILQKNRIAYLHQQGYLENHQYQELKPYMEELLFLADHCLKNSIKALVHYQKNMSMKNEFGKIAVLLREIRNNDCTLTEKLLSYL